MLSDIEVKIKFDRLSNKLQAGQFTEVISETLLLLKKRRHQVFFNILSIAYQSIGEFQKSSDVMEDALRMNPNNPYFLNNMGISHHKLENFKEAEDYFKRGLKIAPNYINILNNLGNLKKDLNFANEAIENYKKSISINNDIIETHLNLANCYQSVGKFDESIFHFQEVLRINPKHTTADRLISVIINYKKNDIHIDNMEKKLSNGDLNDEQQTNLYFALGKVYEDLKDYDQSFENYKKGNDILNKINPFNLMDEKNKLSQIKNFFLQDFEIKSSQDDRKMIFIVGMPRSGTSLVEQILSSHNNVYGGGELVFLDKIIKENFLNDNKDKVLNIMPNVNKLFSKSRAEYVQKIKSLDDSNRCFTDKAPLNFRYIGFIKNIFPNSKVINCQRNSFDIIWSNYKKYFPDSLSFSNNLENIVNYYKLYIDLMDFWRKIFNKHIHDVSYEKLVQNPKLEIENLLRFCDLEWDSNCMKHEKNSRSIKTASATQARKPIYKTAINSSNYFKKYLDEFTKKLNN